MEEINNKFDMFIIFAMSLVFLFSLFSFAENSITETDFIEASFDTNLSNTSSETLELNGSVVEGSEKLYYDGGVLSSPGNYSIDYGEGRIVLREFFNDEVEQKTVHVEYSGRVQDSTNIYLIQSMMELSRTFALILIPIFLFMFFFVLIYYARSSFMS